MPILPEFLTEFIENHDKKLREYYSEKFSTEMLERSKGDILVTVVVSFDW